MDENNIKKDEFALPSLANENSAPKDEFALPDSLKGENVNSVPAVEESSTPEPDLTFSPVDVNVKTTDFSSDTNFTESINKALNEDSTPANNFGGDSSFGESSNNTLSTEPAPTSNFDFSLNEHKEESSNVEIKEVPKDEEKKGKFTVVFICISVAVVAFCLGGIFGYYLGNKSSVDKTVVTDTNTNTNNNENAQQGAGQGGEQGGMATGEDGEPPAKPDGDEGGSAPDMPTGDGTNTSNGGGQPPEIPTGGNGPTPTEGTATNTEAIYG